MTDSEHPSTRPSDASTPVPPSSSGYGAADPSPASSREARKEPGFGAFMRELPVLLLVAFVLAFLLRTFVVQVFYIPSQSMEPTLQVNDRMVVEKVTYQFREPERGEIVVFEGEQTRAPVVEESMVTRVVRGAGQFLGLVPANARDFVKRVIGLPGDTITIEDGVVSVNGIAIEEPYVVYGENKTQGPYEVPEGKLFFLGDNRPNSSDSRYSLGFIDQDQVVGRAVVIIWPFEHIGGLTSVEFPALPSGTASTSSTEADGAAPAVIERYAEAS